ncbi:MAG: pilus assembly protein PilB [Verrucomicrobia bacterium GWF2_62_7]|nr:MAG: pilus assembly protein PilB [Verrucomicrobia bacterium GWF2_62_7]
MFEAESNVLLGILREHQLLPAEQLAEVEAESNRSGKGAAQVLMDMDVLTREQVLSVVAQHLGTELISIKDQELSKETLKLIPPGQARSYCAIPIKLEGNTLHITVGDPLNAGIVEELRFVLDRDIHLVVADPDEIAAMVKQLYGEEGSESVDDLISQIEGLTNLTEVAAPEIMTVENIAAMAGEAPVIRFVNLVLFQAIRDRASDIHFEPFEEQFKIRYRVDGALYEMAPPPKHLALPVTSRIKVMANLNIAERRIPQDGRIQMSIAGRPVDLRVSTLPTQFGESVVLRVLDRSVVNLDLATLGMPKAIFDEVCGIIERPNGIFIVTGPTGSGKTTTLYSCLGRINTIDSKLLTAEDPVEYEIEGIMQVPINPAVGLTFGKALRAFLRQDPDVILVGEMRDLETAQIAIQSSLTGHLVFSTLHTNDASGAVTRLLDMGVEPFLVSSTLEAVLGQRLVRKLCKHCRTAYEPTEQDLNLLGLKPSEVVGKTFFFGKGCSECNDSGYKGRTVICELLRVSDPIRTLINERVAGMVLRDKAMELGMRTMRQDGIRRILDGETSLEEVVKYT